MPRISLCLIARDEEQFLSGCLASVHGAVDQIVLVDTGSVDRTVEIAREHGATVVSHPWGDDFAAARNAAVPHATGDYLLVLDADERLVPGAAARLRAAVADGALVLGMLPLHNASRVDATLEQVADGTHRIGAPIHLPRLVRNTGDVQWEGIVHEQLRRWLERHVRPGGARVVDAAIVHFGNVPAVRQARHKGARNVALLERMCAQDPHLPHGWLHLAIEKLRVGDPAGAEQATECGWAAMVEAARWPGLKPMSVPITSMRARFALAAGQYRTVLDTIDLARTWEDSAHPDLCWYAAQAARARGDLMRAEQEFRAALALKGRPLQSAIRPGVLGWASEYGLGMVLLATKRPAEALGCFDRALAERPGQVELVLGRADAILALGRPADALAVLETLQAADSADRWTIAAEAARALGDRARADAFAARARSGRFIEGTRAGRRNALGSAGTAPPFAP